MRGISQIWDHLIRATQCSLSGLRVALRHEMALQQEIVILCIVIPTALILRPSAVERAVLIGSWMLVIVIELVNSAVETVVDRIGLERHELSGRAKDLGSAAVLCAILLAVAVWVLILFSP